MRPIIVTTRCQRWIHLFTSLIILFDFLLTIVEYWKKKSRREIIEVVKPISGGFLQREVPTSPQFIIFYFGADADVYGFICASWFLTDVVFLPTKWPTWFCLLKIQIVPFHIFLQFPRLSSKPNSHFGAELNRNMLGWLSIRSSSIFIVINWN